MQSQLDAIRVNPGIGLKEFMAWESDVEEAVERGQEPPAMPAVASAAPAERVTLSRDQLAALLAHHADVIAARWDAVAPGAGAWEVAAAYSLRGHAAELTADEETSAVRELLDSIMSFNAEHQPADRDLRGRTIQALDECLSLIPTAQADAVLAVLPAPADRAAVLREAADIVGNDDDCG